MGKIQRKKPQYRKKKQTPESASPASDTVEKKKADKGDSTAKTSAAPAKVSGRDERKPAKKPVSTPKSAPVVRKENFLTRSIQFLREVKAELKKVTWPSRKQTIGSTAVVLVLVLIISLFLGIVDVGLSGLIRMVLP
jgi:preprotein translocase subunit SecE